MPVRSLVIHGHFYQPPRDDPWLEIVFPEGTAGPWENWNQRILSECYAPLAHARRLDGSGRISGLVNCYEWLSFNFGPTLLAWMERKAAPTYERILAADRASRERWGHGNALAQVEHHIILPLAEGYRKKIEIQWALDDFSRRFGCDPEGMWLAETAADTPTLEALAEAGVRFTVLAPRQAKAVLGSHGDWTEVGSGGPDVSRPYLADLPSGRELAVFFYHGPLSQAVAFERLIADGETFWKRLAAEASAHPRGALLPLATDGETYGHHFRFGEMGLAYVLDQARAGRDGLGLTNFAAFLADNPPLQRVRLHEPSSWSCVHGVERWRSDCGCTAGNEPGWNQKWRAPLRQGLDELGKALEEHFQALGPELFQNSEAARLDFGRVLCGSISASDFESLHFQIKLSKQSLDKAWMLLDMVRWSQAMFASCAWFFEEISRVEPRNALTFAMRALQLAGLTGAGDLSEVLLSRLDLVRPNDPRFKTGRELWEREVAPRAEDPARILALALVVLHARGELTTGACALAWPGASVSVQHEPDGGVHVRGTARLSWRFGPQNEALEWSWRDRDADDPFAGTISVRNGEGSAENILPASMFWKNKELAVLGWLDAQRDALLDHWTVLGRNALSRFLEFRAHQFAQVEEDYWAALWPGLALAFVLDDQDPDARPDLVRFLQTHGDVHAARGQLATHIGILAVQALEAGDTDRVRSLVERARLLGLEPNLWLAQNALFAQGLEKADKNILKLLGFSKDLK